MIIKTLAENTSISRNFDNEHGLSLYIETGTSKILFDVGASGLFLENAEKLGVSVADIDFLVISHGHYDHGGGLGIFLQKNSTADVFIHEQAFGGHYAQRANNDLEYIGLDRDLRRNSQIVFTSDNFIISEKIQLYSDVDKKELEPSLNSNLFIKRDGQVVNDIFIHEQNIIIDEGDNMFLLTGCAHNGIINIVEHFYKLRGSMPDYIVGGFHLSGRSGDETPDVIDRIGRYLADTKAKCYTCHCTGIGPYNRLKAIMGDNIEYLSAGSKISI